MSTSVVNDNSNNGTTTTEAQDRDETGTTSSTSLNDHVSSLAAATATATTTVSTRIITTTKPTATTTIVSGSISPYNPTCDQAQETIIRLLELKGNDIIFDLGCGDGRLLQKAVQLIPDIRCIGIDIDPIFINRGIESIRTNLSVEQQHRIQLRIGSILNLKSRYNNDDNTDENDINTKDDDAMTNENNTTDTLIDSNNNREVNKCSTDVIGSDCCNNLTLHDDATAVYIFLLPKAIKKIQDMLNEVISHRRQQRRKQYDGQEEGSKQPEIFQVVTYMFQIHDWTPTLIDRTTKAGAPIYLYRFDI